MRCRESKGDLGKMWDRATRWSRSRRLICSDLINKKLMKPGIWEIVSHGLRTDELILMGEVDVQVTRICGVEVGCEQRKIKLCVSSYFNIYIFVVVNK